MSHSEEDHPAPAATYATGIHGCLLELRAGGFTPRRILDIGGSVGQFALMVHAVWPEAHVTSIEANEVCIPHLAWLADEWHHALLSDSEKDVTFWMSSDDQWSQGASYYKETLESFTYDVPTQRRTTTLSALLAGCEPFQLVKLDTQGSELDIIRGGREIVRQASFVLCEMAADGEPMNVGAPTRAEVEAELASLGFGDGLLLEWWFECATGRRVNEDWIYRKV